MTVGVLAAGARHRAAAPTIPGSKIFATDWGSNVSVSTPSPTTINAGSSATWAYAGGDLGFNFPVLVNGGTSFVHPISPSRQVIWDPTSKAYWTGANGTGTRIWLNQIETGPRYDTGTGNVLHYQEAGPNDTNAGEQLTHEIHPGADVTSLYISIDLMFPANWATQLGANCWWEILSTKTADYLTAPSGYRIAFYAGTNNSTVPYWNFSADNNANGADFWSFTATSPTVPQGTPFRLEWAVNKANANTYPTLDSTCCSWVKLNGARLFRQDGPGNTANNNGGGTCTGFMTSSSPVNRIFTPNTYAARTSGNPIDLYVGHWEVWSGGNYRTIW